MKSFKKEEINKNIGKVLKEYRLKNKLTQEQIAEKLDISVKYISRIENGTGGIKLETLSKYINILCITPNVIFEDLIVNEDLIYQLQLSKKICEIANKNTEFANELMDLLLKNM